LKAKSESSGFREKSGDLQSVHGSPFTVHREAIRSCREPRTENCEQTEPSSASGHRFVRGIEGFSLIEIVIVCVLIGIIAAVIIPPLHQGVQSFTVSETRGDLTSQARQAATRIMRELRNIRSERNDIPPDTAPPTHIPKITSAGASSITFEDVEGNTITFALSGSTVNRNGNALADQVSSLQFRYFDGSNTPLTNLPLNPDDIDNVRRIMVTLTLAEAGQTVSVTEQAFLRELTGY